MTCSEARDVIGACSIQNDKLKVLNCIKRLVLALIYDIGPYYNPHTACDQSACTQCKFSLQTIPSVGYVFLDADT